MESFDAMAGLAALAQPTRLDAFRLLVAAEPAGLTGGEVARRLAVPANTISAHLAALAQAGLVTAARSGRSIVYRASVARVRALVLFLLADCCGGDPDACAPALAALAPGRPGAPAAP